MWNKIVFLLIIFSLCAFNISRLHAQTVNTRESGLYRSCLTWEDQSRVGIDPIKIINNNEVLVETFHKAFEYIEFSGNSAIVLQNSSSSIEITTVMGNAGMDSCRHHYVLSDYNNLSCAQLWNGYGGIKNDWDMSIGLGSGATNSSRALMVRIEKPGRYKLNSITIMATIPWRGIIGSDGCLGQNFYITAKVQKNGADVSSSYVICDSCSNLATITSPTCNISGIIDANVETEHISHIIGNANIDLGDCNLGDEISVLFNIKESGAASSFCKVGNMRGFALYNISKSYSVTFSDIAKTEYYSEGDTVKIKATFKEKKKFANWSSLGDEVIFSNHKLPSTFFVMPGKNIEITANYVEAPYKVVIHKPAKIQDTTNKQLVFETDSTYVSYYASGDRVDFFAPSENFKSWEKSAGTYDNFIYHLNTLGGGQKSNTWYKIQIYDIEVFPTYTNLPYWSTQKTKKGWLEANFIERVNPNGEVTIPGGATFYRAFSQEEKEVIMRALNQIENTFAIAPKRTISINFGVINIPGSGTGAATSPMPATPSPGYDSPKEKWLSTDFGGRAAGRVAVSSKIEAVWRDQKNILPNGAPFNNTFIGFRDGTIIFNQFEMNYWYKGESPNSGGRIDMQCVVMHELGHNICFHSLNGKVDEFTALDVFVVNKYDHSISLLNRNMKTDDGGEAILLNEFVKSYWGDYLEVVCGSDNAFDFGHLDTSPGVGVGAQYRSADTRARRFFDFELALLQEMGWKINPDAWTVKP